MCDIVCRSSPPPPSLMPTFLTSRGYGFTAAGNKQRCHVPCHAMRRPQPERAAHAVFSGRLSVPRRTRSFSANASVSIKFPRKAVKSCSCSDSKPRLAFFLFVLQSTRSFLVPAPQLRAPQLRAKHFANGTGHTSHVTHLLAASASVFATNSCPQTHQKDAMQHASTAQKRQ